MQCHFLDSLAVFHRVKFSLIISKIADLISLSSQIKMN